MVAVRLAAVMIIMIVAHIPCDVDAVVRSVPVKRGEFNLPLSEAAFKAAQGLCQKQAATLQQKQ